MTSLLATVVNAALFSGLTVAIGAVAIRFLLLPRCGLTVSERAPALRDAATAAMWGAALVLVAAPARALSQVLVLADPGEPWMPMMRLVLTTTSLGRTLQLQAIGAVLAVAAFSVARKGSARGWWATAIVMAALATIPGLEGHPASAPGHPLALTAATLHVLCVGAWIGGLFHLWRSSRVASEATLLLLLRAFHAIALTSVALLVAAGAYQTWITLGAPENLLSTSWGRLLVAKLLLVFTVLALGYRHWRTSERSVTGGARAKLSASLGRELVLAAAVLAVTSVLSMTASPE